MNVLFIVYIFISTIPAASRISTERFTIKYGLSSRPIQPYDYSCVYSQPCEEGLYYGYSNYGAGDRWVCDDFILDLDADITEIVVWEIYTGGTASHYNIAISVDDKGDSDPNTNTVIWEENVPCTNLFMGWG
jgi:hypothetical protein